MPVDALKIDKSFVDDVLTDSDDAEIAIAIIRLSHALNLRVVAEGVETVEQAVFLKQNGCDEIQGYVISKPQTPDKVCVQFAQHFVF
jgi:diguanylate cyclase